MKLWTEIGYLFHWFKYSNQTNVAPWTMDLENVVPQIGHTWLVMIKIPWAWEMQGPTLSNICNDIMELGDEWRSSSSPFLVGWSIRSFPMALFHYVVTIVILLSISEYVTCKDSHKFSVRHRSGLHAGHSKICIFFCEERFYPKPVELKAIWPIQTPMVDIF